MLQIIVYPTVCATLLIALYLVLQHRMWPKHVRVVECLGTTLGDPSSFEVQSSFFGRWVPAKTRMSFFSIRTIPRFADLTSARATAVALMFVYARQHYRKNLKGTSVVRESYTANAEFGMTATLWKFNLDKEDDPAVKGGKDV